MRRFRFRLQSVLRLRSQLERQARGELAAAAAAVAGVDQRMAAARRGRDDCAAEARAPGALGELARALEAGLQRHLAQLAVERQRAVAVQERAQSAWLGRVREQRAVARLRDDQLAAWRTAAVAGEQAELEALAEAARGGRPRAGGTSA